MKIAIYVYKSHGQYVLKILNDHFLHLYLGTNPGVYAQELIKNCEKLALDCNSNSICNPAELLELSVGETQSPGFSTVLLAQLVGQVQTFQSLWYLVAFNHQYWFWWMDWSMIGNFKHVEVNDSLGVKFPLSIWIFLYMKVLSCWMSINCQ